MAICIGCGLEISDGILQVDVDGTTIGCGASGLQSLVTAFPGISTDVCNGTKLGTDGKVWSPCPEGVAGIENAASPQQGDLPVNMNGAPGSTYNFESVVSTITNTSQCCTISGNITFMTNFQGTVAVNGRFTAAMELQIDGGAYIPSNPSAYEVVHNVGNATMSWGINLWDSGWFPFTPGQVRTFRAKAVLTILAGTASADTGAQFETQWTLIPTSCGC